jgi:hypothetical protein
LIAAVALAAAAYGQQGGGFDAHGFRLATGDADLRAPVQFVRASDVRALQWSLGMAVEYASRPLVFERDGGREIPLRDLVAANLAGGFAPVDRFRVDLAVPVVLSSVGPGGVRSGPTAGDLRASTLLALLSPDQRDGVGLGLLAALDVPTGEPARWLGSVAPAGTVALSATVEGERLALSWLAGGRVAPNTPPDERPQRTQGGDTAEGAIAGSVRVTGGLGIGVEAQASVPVDPVVRAAIGVPATAMGSVRYRLDGSSETRAAYLTAGVGTALSAGAGASPLRAFLGGGFGGRARTAPADRDGDGLDDRADACPGEAESVNAYRDDDGCPDLLPRIVFTAEQDDAPSEAFTLEVTSPAGARTRGQGQVGVSGLPGDVVTAAVRAAGCQGGQITARMPPQGTLEVAVPIARQDAQLTIRVQDAAGRPLEMAEARYLVEDEACAPEDRAITAGRGVHQVGAGPLTVYVTAPGYGVHEQTLSPAPGAHVVITAVLAPTQLGLKDGVFRFAKPITFLDATDALGVDGYLLLDQVASVLLSTGGRFRVRAFAPPNGRSRSRADVVVEYLVAQGIERDRLEPVAGGTKPAGQQDWVQIEALED